MCRKVDFSLVAKRQPLTACNTACKIKKIYNGDENSRFFQSLKNWTNQKMSVKKHLVVNDK